MIDRETQHLITLTALETAKYFGAGTLELSYTKACARYGTIFKHLVRHRKVTPCRVGNGKNGTHYYAISDIISAIAVEQAAAKLI